MGVLLAIALIAYVMTRAVNDARMDHTYAKQGLVSPRLEAKYGAGAREKTARYGFVDYLGDAWSDHWQRRAAALEADRKAYVANPGQRVRFRDRLARATQVMSAAARKLVDPVPVKQPADEVDVVPAGLVPALAVDTGDVPVDTVRITDDGDEQWDGREWKRCEVRTADDRAAGTGKEEAMSAAPVPKTATEIRAECDRLFNAGKDAWNRRDWAGAVAAWDELQRRYGRIYEDKQVFGSDTTGALRNDPLRHLHAEARKRMAKETSEQPADDTPSGKTTTPSTGGTMTAPTGEAVNYETTVSELEALANEQRGHVDACQAALKSLADVKSAINNVQESYRASASAAASIAEHLPAMNLDGVTLANAGTTADAMPAGVVDAMYDQLEDMESQASSRLADAEVALASTETNLQHIQATYGDAHATVAGNLSGDSSFLDSGGAAGTGGGGGSAAGAGGGLAGSAGNGPGAGPSSSGGQSGSGGITESGTGDINFTGVMGGGGVKVPKIPASGAGGANIQHNGTGEVNVSGSAFGDNATVNSG